MSTWYIWQNDLKREFSVKVQYICPVVKFGKKFVRFDLKQAQEYRDAQDKAALPPAPKRSPSPPESSDEEEEDEDDDER